MKEIYKSIIAFLKENDVAINDSANILAVNSRNYIETMYIDYLYVEIDMRAGNVICHDNRAISYISLGDPDMLQKVAEFLKPPNSYVVDEEIR